MQNEDINRAVSQAKTPTIIVSKGSAFICAQQKMIVYLEEAIWDKVFLTYVSMFYLFNLSYPEGADCALLVVQTEVLNDQIHVDDEKNEQFVSARKKYRKFIGKP